jgi:hypothetical protein
MQAVLVFLALSVIVGARHHSDDSRIPKGLLIAFSLVLALALYSRRVV